MAYDPLFEKFGTDLEPIRTPTQQEIAFFAGYYEGEGSVTVNTRNATAFSVCVSQRDPQMLYRMRELWGGSVRYVVNRGKKPSKQFEGYNSWSNPLYRWRISGDRGREFLLLIYPYLSDRRKEQVNKVSLSFTGYKARTAPILSPERYALRSNMTEHEKYLESKKFFRANNLESERAKNREYVRQKYGYKPRKVTAATSTTKLVQ